MRRFNIGTIAVIFLTCYFFQLWLSIFFVPIPTSQLEYSSFGYEYDYLLSVQSSNNNNIHQKDSANIDNNIKSVENYNNQQTISESISKEQTTNSRPILTAYLKSTNGEKLKVYEYPHAYEYNNNNNINNIQEKNSKYTIHPFPIIDEYPDGDSFLPWIHDLHPSSDESTIRIYAQNRRRCHTGKGNEDIMKQLEGQIVLFQPIPVTYDDENHQYRVSSYEDANPQSKETRFICRFKDITNDKSWKTFSTYPFNYEFISWRKHKNSMFERTGQDMGQFWLSSLQFDCPVPRDIQANGIKFYNNELFLDIIPIRTPVRYEQFYFHKGHGGPISFDLDNEWGKDLYIEPIERSTRWENILINPVTLPWTNKEDSASIVQKSENKKPYQLVACTWTSASHNRRGDAAVIEGGRERLQEWIAFHLLVGFDHIVVYDNSGATNNSTTLKDITDKFGSNLVTYVDWPCKICNNNRPAHNDPGERSSQYAAEASCRGRFAPYTDWMSFLDPDEYLVPMGNYNSWKDILTNIDNEGKKILKFRSTRARAIPSLMKSVYGPDVPKCPTIEEVNGDNVRKASCLVKSEEHTYLQTYNCEYIKSPKPDRFQRAMKQIYRPDYVLSHFVHYSTVTVDLARTKDHSEPGKYNANARTSDPKTERFIDEINEGVLIHAKSIVPEEAITRTRCQHKLRPGCNVGIPCPDDLPFDDKTHQDGFLDENGKFCNCWVNRKVENTWIPQLEESLKRIM